jgi:hemerythrin-like domain-containing protein
MTQSTPATLKAIADDHSALSAVLRSLLPLIEQGPGDAPERFFDVLRAMLFYIDEFPEKRHHPNESNLLFPRVVREAPELMAVVHKLEADHIQGEHWIRELQHQLMAWELLGNSRRAVFVENLQEYIGFYLAHMRMEETELLPVARRKLSPADWAELDLVFEAARDPLAGGKREPSFDRLFTRIVLATPAPLGVGPQLHASATR